MQKTFLLGALALAAVSTPAFADKYFAVTPSGAAEMLFPEKPGAVIGKLSSKCIDVRWTVVTSSANELVCEAPLNMGQSIVGQLLMGNSYSTPPRRFFRFNVAEVNGISRVQASGWMELQMAFGQVKRNDFSGAEFQNGIMNFMGGAGGKLPVGTKFPNHVFMGFDSDAATHGKKQALRVKSVQPGSAADKAGLQIGDLVTSVAGKKFDSDDDFLDATARAAQKPTFEVEVVRGGTAMKLTMERAFRSDWSEAVVASADAGPAPSSASGGAPSIADELSKLAKLKADGVLSDAEFDAQKKKLLDR